MHEQSFTRFWVASRGKTRAICGCYLLWEATRNLSSVEPNGVLSKATWRAASSLGLSGAALARVIDMSDTTIVGRRGVGCPADWQCPGSCVPCTLVDDGLADAHNLSAQCRAREESRYGYQEDHCGW